jgi:hypothetical protein
VTCSQVGGSQVGDDVLVSDTRQFLLQDGVGAFQGCGVRWGGSLAAEGVGASHGPSAGRGGAEVDLVCLEAADTTVDDDSAEGLDQLE